MEQPNIEMFTCPKCKNPKIRDEFGTCNGKRNTWCKACCAAAVRHCYANNIEYRASSKAAGERRALRNHRFLYAYLRAHPCVDCGESNPLVLQFDHVTERTKSNDVTGFIACSIARILKEIALCVVRCGNCHTKKTAAVFNTIRFQLCKEAAERGEYSSVEKLLLEETTARERRNHGSDNAFFEKQHTEDAKEKMRNSKGGPLQRRLF